MSYIRFENIVKSFGSNTVLNPDVVRVHCFDVCPVLRQ